MALLSHLMYANSMKFFRVENTGKVQIGKRLKGASEFLIKNVEWKLTAKQTAKFAFTFLILCFFILALFVDTSRMNPNFSKRFPTVL